MSNNQNINFEIENCYKFIANNWKEEYYYDAKESWNNIQKNIVENGVKCLGCKTCWISKNYILKDYIFTIKGKKSIGTFCPNCDTFVQPFLSNPINKKYIFQYIPEKYHKYIL